MSTRLPAAAATRLTLEAPKSVPCFDAAEFVVRVEKPAFGNPFTDVALTATFHAPHAETIFARGFADAADGSLFRLRFSPALSGIDYTYEIRFSGPGLMKVFDGVLQVEASSRPGPVIVAPHNPKHFIHSGSRHPFYHLGYTAYHLLDPSNDDAQVAATLDYCVQHGFNKVRFLLTGYPRDTVHGTSSDVEHGVPAEALKAPNNGARAGHVNTLPAWEGREHAFDFTRFNVTIWQRVDRAVQAMREHGIVATCVVTIEKQGLQTEYGWLTENEYRLYRYAVARLAAFDNVWWDLGNEINEVRNPVWGDTMGAFVRREDPYGRLASAHGHAEFPYARSAWADYIISQHYGQLDELYWWAQRFHEVPKPFVNEEYGYEFNADRPGHGLNADWVRRSHWAIAMAGGYATYGDYTGGVAWFYMGEPGRGRAPAQLKHLRAFFEKLPFQELTPQNQLVTRGYCLAKTGSTYVVYLPEGGECEVNLGGARGGSYQVTWYDPRTGRSVEGGALESRGRRKLGPPPIPGDVVALLARATAAP
jgi:hypothetical protein